MAKKKEKEKMEHADCQHGYSDAQVERILGKERFKEFKLWMVGQTGAICNGMKYDPEIKQDVPTNCGPHGFVTYPWDFTQYLAGREPLD